MRRQETLQRLKDVLLERREMIRESLQQELESLYKFQEPQVGDIGDAALESDSGEISSRIAEVESLELADIERALERMREGAYGNCEACGQNIPIARLQALPYATLCVRCQRQREAGQLSDLVEEHWDWVPNGNDDGAFLSLDDEPDLVA